MKFTITLRAEHKLPGPEGKVIQCEAEVKAEDAVRDRTAISDMLLYLRRQIITKGKEIGIDIK